MAGHKGFRNLPKLERLKRGRPRPGPRPAERGAGRLPRPRPPLPSHVVALTDSPPQHQRALRALAEILPLTLPLPTGERRRGGEAYVVGGAVRDLLLSRPAVEDLDLTVPSGALAVARSLADRLGGAFVALDEERGAGRIIVKDGGREYQVDVTDFRAPTLEADLRARDFTVNAIAVPIGPLVRDGTAGLVDPTGGGGDLARRRLRLCGPGGVAGDPIPGPRGVRLAVQAGVTL